MIKKIKKHLESEEKKTILKNILFLGLFRGSNIILPLVTLPYLVKVLGVDKFGLIAFAVAFMRFFTIVTEYGFNLTATREISINRNNNLKVSEIVSSIYIIKFCLMILSFLVLLVIVFSFATFSNEYPIYVLSFGMVVGNMLFPIWFFQGMEKMKYITILNFISKLIFTILIFVLIKQPSHYIYVPVINSVGFILSGVLALFVLKRQFSIFFFCPSWDSLRHQVVDGWHIFISTISISMYRDANIFILGIFSTTTIVAYYATAEKIIKSTQLLLDPISQALFPNISKKFAELNLKSSLTILKRIAKYYAVILVAMVALLLLLVPVIGHFIWGMQIKSFVYDMNILAFVVFFGGFNYLLGIIGLVNLKQKKAFSQYVLVAGVTNIVLCLVLVQNIQDIGCAIALLSSEIVLFSLCVRKILLCPL